MIGISCFGDDATPPASRRAAFFIASRAGRFWVRSYHADIAAFQRQLICWLRRCLGLKMSVVPPLREEAYDA